MCGVTVMFTQRQMRDHLLIADPQTFSSVFTSIVSSTHRNHLLFLALLGQIFDAVNKELVGADVRPASLNHPTAQLHQLMGCRKKHF